MPDNLPPLNVRVVRPDDLPWTGQVTGRSRVLVHNDVLSVTDIAGNDHTFSRYGWLSVHIEQAI